MRVSSAMVLVVGVAAYEEEAAMLQVHGGHSDYSEEKPVNYSEEKPVNYSEEKPVKSAKEERVKYAKEKRVKHECSKEKGKPVKCSMVKPVKPSKGKPVKPSKGKPVKPSKGKPVKYAKEKRVKHECSKEKGKPVKCSKVKPVKPSKVKPVKPSKVKPVKPSKGKPVKHSKGKSVKHSEEKPVKYSKEKPVKSSEEKPVKFSEEKPVKSAKYSKEKPVVKYSKEKVEKYTKAAHGDDHVDMVLPDPIWLRHSEDSKLVFRNCHVQGAKKCSTFDGGKVWMDSMKDNTEYGYGTAHPGEHCCVEKVKQCETKYITRCNRKKAKDLTQEQCEKVAGHATMLSFQSVVEKKHKFPGCYYRKVDGKTFWNSFVADGESHGDRRVYAPICKVRRCKRNTTTVPASPPLTTTSPPLTTVSPPLTTSSSQRRRGSGQPPLTPATTVPPQEQQSFVLNQSWLVPEGIAYSATTGFIVGSLFNQGLQKVRLAGGMAEVELFAKPANMNGTVGVHIANGKVFATHVTGFPSAIGVAGVWAFDAETAALVGYADLGPTAVEKGVNITLNDVTVDGDGHIYTTDSFTGMVWKISPDFAEVTLLCTIPEALPALGAIVNGLDWVPDTKILLVNYMDQGTEAPFKGAVYSVNTDTGVFRKVTFDGSVTFRGLDGLVVDGCCTAYSVDARQRKVFKYTTEDYWVSAVVTATCPTQCSPSTGALVDGDMWVLCPEGFGAGPYHIEKVDLQMCM